MPRLSDEYGVLKVKYADENDSETSSSLPAFIQIPTVRTVSFGAWQNLYSAGRTGDFVN